jgi:uncharacterized membrane protein YGL010W
MKVTAGHIDNLKLHLIDHLSLYNLFHRSKINRLIHVVFVPITIFSVALPLSLLQFNQASEFSQGAVVVAILIGLSLVWVDVKGGILSTIWLVMIALIAGRVTQLIPTVWSILGGVLLYGASMYCLVVWGHSYYEEKLKTSQTGKLEDSNLYFRKGFVAGMNLGRPVIWADQVAQFNISPLAVTYDVLFSFGLYRKLENKIEARRQELQRKLALGKMPFSPDTSTLARIETNTEEYLTCGQDQEY